MKKKKWYQFWIIKRCDNCGMFSPPIFDNNPRLCVNCASTRGLYGAVNDPTIKLKTSGKINNWKLQFPIKMSWCGWWKL